MLQQPDRYRRDKACLVSTATLPQSRRHRPHRNHRHRNHRPPQTPNPTDKTPGQRRFQNQGKNTISSILGGYKSAVTKHANRMGLEFDWQARFHDHVIRDEASFIKITNYIINNPKNWKDDRFYD